MNILSSTQKELLRLAFTLIDGALCDLLITREDIESLAAAVGLENLNVQQLMDNHPKGMEFAHFLSIIGRDLARLPVASVLRQALQEFLSGGPVDDFEVGVDELKDECCLVQIGPNESRLLRSDIDDLIREYTSERADGTKVFLAQRWLDVYAE